MRLQARRREGSHPPSFTPAEQPDPIRPDLVKRAEELHARHHVARQVIEVRKRQRAGGIPASPLVVDEHCEASVDEGICVRAP